MPKVIRVNMTDLSVRIDEAPEAWAGLGGRALTSTVVAAEVPPTCHPLGPNNKLVFAPGLLSGTAAGNAGRMSAGAKSPLTGTIKESNAGGTCGRMLGRLDIKAIIIEGQPASTDTWYNIRVSGEGAVMLVITGLLFIIAGIILDVMAKNDRKTFVIDTNKIAYNKRH